MSFIELLAYCEDKKIRFSLLEEQLKIKAPEGTLQPDVVEKLRQFKPELIALLKSNDSAIYSTNDIDCIEREDDLLPSFGQEQLWLVDNLYDSQHAYHFARVLTFKGHLNIGALTAAFNFIIERHESLRTVLKGKDGVLYQQVNDTQQLDIPLIDLSELDAKTVIKASEEIQQNTAQQAFNLATDCMLRLQLVRLSQDHHQLNIVLHHIASDGWSLGLLITEFTTLYHQNLQGEELALPKLPVQYVDYAHWQRTVLQPNHFEGLIDYWQAKLAGCPDLHNLPLDKARPAEQGFQGKSVVKVINSNVTLALKNKANEMGCTLFTVVESLFSLLISRYSGEDDVIIGTPVANRHHESVEGLIGYFVNTVPLRHQINPELSFDEYLHQVNQEIVEAFEHQQLPFEQLIQATVTTRSQSYGPLVQILFSLQSNDIPELALSDVTCAISELETSLTLFDLQLEVTEVDDGLRLNWQYATDLFEDTTIARMATHFELLLTNALAQPNIPLGQLEFITAEERHQQLVEWNDTAADYPKDKCIHELFEAQVKKTPDAIAVVFEDSQLTYKELNQKANQLAHYLIEERQVIPDTLVGICVERSLEMIVGIMGILKASGAYVPLDPDYPAARLAYMLEDANLTTVLTQTSLKGETPVTDNQAIYLDSEDMLVQLQGYSTSNPGTSTLTSNHLAYVIYTSGSTGNPKGVMVEHMNTNALISWARQYYGFADLKNVLASTSICFDLSVFECFVPLSVGGKITIVQSILDLPLLEDIQGITLINTVPSAIESLLKGPSAYLYSKAINLAGEPLKQGLVDKLYKAGVRAVYDLYGPSEDTTYSTCIKREVSGIASIGKPITNTKCYVVTSGFTISPTGVAGELYLGGSGLSRGYLNQSALTAEKYVLNPFFDTTNPNSSDRLYKTGDLVRYLPDGNLEFLGRIDHQVKIRGFRIELGEIEHQLLMHEAVNDAVVVALPNNNDEGDKRLVAYVTHDNAMQMLDEGDNSQALRTMLIDSLRHKLSQDLPSHMVPSAFVVLEHLPLTPNGKVDRKGLPAPDMSLQQKAYVAPTTETEKLLCEIWQDILGLEQVSISDNFFELGGHSLLATRLVANINTHLNVDSPLKLLFSNPTITSLTVALSELAPGHRRPDIQLVSREQDLQPSFAQQRLWLLDKIDGGSAHYNMPGALRLTGDLDVDALTKAINTIIERHESLRTYFTEDSDGQPLQVVRLASAIEIPVTNISLLPLGEREFDLAELVEQEASKPFNLNSDLSSDLMLRARLVKVEDQVHVLLVTMHHIASDGWSIGILINEFSALYQAYVQGEDNPLPELAIQYADYAQWQRDWLQGEVLDAQLGYWKTQLAALPVVHSLPLDKARPKVQTFKGTSHQSIIASSDSYKLNALCRSVGGTLFMGLYTAFSVLLSRYSNETDIVVGSPIANREQTEIANLIGFFVNTLVLRSDLSNNPSFTELLNQSKATLLDAYAHQQVPFEQLVEVLQPERSVAHSPLFQVMLVLQNNDEGELELPGLTLNSVEQSGDIAKYDLTLNITETSQGLQLSWEYNTDLFNDDTIARLAKHFDLLLTGLVNQPDENVFSIDMLSKEDTHQQLIEWNDTAADYEKGKCIHELFEQQVTENPDAVAVVYGNSQLTYGELNGKANQLAHYLIEERQIKPDTLVGICIERSLEMVIGVLGILKTGGAYAPLDAQYGKDIVRKRVQVINPHVVLTGNSSQGIFESLAIATINLQDEGRETLLCSSDNVSRSAEVDNLAYVLTTSGSTGEPKLIGMQHKTLVNLIEGMKENCLEIKAVHSVLQLASIGFDMSFTELCLSLLQGGQLHLSKPQEQFDARHLSEEIQGSAISLLNLPYAMLQALATYSNESGIVYPALSMVLSSAEKLIITSEIRTFFTRHSMVRLVNHYGPSETNVCTSNVLPLTCSEWPIEPSIGKPINNVSCYVLDEDGQLLPPGVVGELHVGGMGLAAGYVGDEALTAEKFITNPFYDIAHPSSGERLYKTGDLVKWCHNEELIYIGRADSQVKVRGFRVELGAVESALTNHEAVNEACVLFNAQRQCLIAYISVYNYYSETLLTSYLSAGLPDYMVPAVFVILESLPLTPNGKVDRKGLPEPDMSLQQKAYVAPTTETEKVLCEIWQGVLDLEQVGITDNFFELGGHSLLAVRLTSLVQKQFGQEVSLRCLMEGPSVAELAVVLSDGQMLTANFELIVPDTKKSYQVFPLTDIQQAYWLGRNGEFELSNVGSHMYSETVVNNFDITQFQAAWNKMIARHNMLRMVITEDGQQRVLETVPEYVFDIIDTRDLDAEATAHERLKLRASMSHQVFTGLQWPLFDFRICQLSDNKSVLHLSLDALMVDASSTALLAYELSLLNEEPERELPPLALTFRDCVLAHQGLKQTSFYQKSADYWLARVEDFPARPALPLAVEPSAIVEQQSERHELVLNKNEWQILTSQAQQHQVTPTTLFLGCFAEILNRWIEQPHFALNLTLFNRVPFHEQVNDIVGDFTTLTLLEMDYRQADVSFVERLVAIQKQLWSDLEYRYFGGMEMLSALRKETGQPVSYPVVVTSILGLEADSQSIFSGSDEQNYAITQTSQVWLDVQLSDKNGGLQVVWDSVRGLFPDGMLHDMFTALQGLLISLANDESLWQSTQLLELPAEQTALISTVNDTAQSFEIALLHDPIKRQIHLHSQNQNQNNIQANKVAVRTSNKALTYLELGQRSQVLANQLQTAGAAPNHLVAVVMEKGWQQVVAVVGVLEAGAAYLPVDANLPQERINLLLSAGEVTQVVTIPAYADCVPAQYITRIISDESIEAEYAALTADTSTRLQNSVKPSDLAYVIFTSGSTGEPKGVMIDHQGALNTINDINQRYQVNANDSMFGLSNLSFDLSVYDIFGVLGAGGTLVLPQPEEYRDPKAWMQYLNSASPDERITLWNTVPALMQMLVEYCEDNAADDISLDLRLVLMSGDWIPTDLPARIHGVTESAELISLGGATEASIWSIYYPIEQVASDWTSIPYGKALANQQFYVLQQDLSQSPLWVTGDLYIGGIGLAKGYWRDAEKTAASFITHPVTNERLYKTGDRGRLLPDGNIEFMGRIDHQVKIQGFRVELGEIESCLTSYPEISDAIVTTYKVNRAHNLVAYIVSELTEHESIAFQQQVSDYLKNTLPHYMVPQHIIPIPKIPLTANGKVNRKDLPEPDIGHYEYIAPQTDVEHTLCGIWRELLEIERIGTTDNFYLLGGNSLLITRMISSIQNSLGINIPLALVYNEPIIQVIAMHIQNIQARNMAKLSSENDLTLEDECIEELL